MPLYFFDLASPGTLEVDEVGVDFADLHIAYLDACRAVLEISGEMVRVRRDPTRHRFEVRDAWGRSLLDIPFAEMLRPSRPPPHRAFLTQTLRSSVQATLARNRALRLEVSAGCRVARATMAQARATLERARRR